MPDWLAAGALFATHICSVGVMSIPMLLHRSTDIVSAALYSMRLEAAQTGQMLWRALLLLLLIVTVVGVATLPAFAGLRVAVPVVGHASWPADGAAVAD